MAKPTLRPSERELGTFRANRTLGARAIGGHLVVTDQRVIFLPHRLDSISGAKIWECALGALSVVEMTARGFNPFNGSIRRRLQIESDGMAERFVVSRGEAVVASIKQAASVSRNRRRVVPAN